MFADPQEITVDNVTKTLLRTGSALDAGKFSQADGTYGLSISHAYAKRTRRTVRLDYKVLAPDVMDSSLNVPYTGSIYLVSDMPNVGISLTTQQNLGEAFTGWLTSAGTYDGLYGLLNGES